MEPGESSNCQRGDVGKMEHGCEHYKRRCKIRAPCCDTVFPCRHCHNDYTMNLDDRMERHEIDRTQVEKVICSICDTEQQVARVCSHCGVNMGEYFCGICKFYDDDMGKEHFHCDKCGICRTGGQDNYFHCETCGSCYGIALLDNHICWEGVMLNDCPVCCEKLFDSLKPSQILKCGHAMHVECAEEMGRNAKFACPLCSKSMVDMSEVWTMFDEEVAETGMPHCFRHQVSLLCNDCNTSSEVTFHVVGMKCPNCNSYNTRRS